MKEKFIGIRNIRSHAQDNRPGSSVDEAIISGVWMLSVPRSYQIPKPQHYILSSYLELFLSMDIYHYFSYETRSLPELRIHNKIKIKYKMDTAQFCNIMFYI